jgi:N utilization substance protein B
VGARSKARKRALDVLYAAELRGTTPEVVLGELQRDSNATSPVGPYAVTLVEGVVEHRDEIDDLIDTYAEGWSRDRMPAVDRNAIRIGIFELLWMDDVPRAVAIDEAVGLARQLSTDDSPRFVNGILSRIGAGRG